jgi:hypothetical protein
MATASPPHSNTFPTRALTSADAAQREVLELCPTPAAGISNNRPARVGPTSRRLRAAKAPDVRYQVNGCRAEDLERRDSMRPTSLGLSPDGPRVKLRVYATS